ncbi:MAG: ribitol-5-phosphate 2-dehydrogenase / D-ribitol-5-phosphate cytidylyltransferase [bacterium]|nr:ribitol-5-phosphate 2-dehydrogenase / D-ribitol-5-phosphate cytidylyltransferase [bacterium]
MVLGLFLGKKVHALILAGGEGKRLGSEIPKQFLKLKDRTILEWAIMPFEKSENVDEIVVVVNKRFLDFAKELLGIKKYRKLKSITCGGKTRQESSKLGLDTISEEDGIVLIHDAVRPFVFKEDIENLLSALRVFKAVTLSTPVKETVALVSERESFVVEDIPPRERLFTINTPQGFYISLIKEAHRRAVDDGFFDAPDDCSLILKYFKEEKVHLIPGTPINVKITYPIDLKIAEVLLSEKAFGGTKA